MLLHIGPEAAFLVAVVALVASTLAAVTGCPLCEITYGPLGRKPAWQACAARLPTKVVEMHRDRLPQEWGIARGELPCIVARVGNERPHVLLARQEIASCHGSVAELERRLVRALGVTTTSTTLETAS